MLGERIRASLAPHWLRVIGVAVALVVASVLPLLLPLVFREIVDRLAAGGTLDSIWVLALYAGLIGVAATLAAWAHGRMAAELGARVVETLQCRAVEKLSNMPLGFFNTLRPGAVSSRVTNDVYATEPLFSEVLVTGAASIVTLVAAAGVLATVDIRLVLLFALVPVVLVPVRMAERRINDTIVKVFEANSSVTQAAESFLTYDGIVLARLAGRTVDELGTFVSHASTLREGSTRMAGWKHAVGASYGATFAVLTAAAVVLAVAVVDDGASLGVVVLVLFYMQLVRAPIERLVGLRYPMIRAGIALDRVFDVLESQVEPDGRARRIDTPELSQTTERPVRGSLRFEEVAWEYPSSSSQSIAGLSNHGASIAIPGIPFSASGELRTEEIPRPEQAVLRGVSFEVKPGEQVALIGRSGAGKSTLAHLTAGFIVPSAGRVLLGDSDIQSFSERELADGVALISQDTHLLHDTIAANLRYFAPEATDDELWYSLERAQLRPLVESLEGLETRVGEKGKRFSAGERQRISIARAFLKSPAVVVADESTSHLDAENEAQVQAALRDSFSQAAVLVIAHRPTTVRFADRILLLEGGLIADEGTYKDLLAAGGTAAALLGSLAVDTAGAGGPR